MTFFLSRRQVPLCVDWKVVGSAGITALKLIAVDTWEQQPTSLSPIGHASLREGPQHQHISLWRFCGLSPRGFIIGNG